MSYRYAVASSRRPAATPPHYVMSFKYPCTVLLMLLTACAGDREVAESVVRDSAGVSIVEYPEGVDTAPVWRLAQNPVMAVGEVDGREELLFSRIIAAFEGRGGELVIADAESREIRWFDRDGNHLQTVGGSGEGPGEFSQLSWVERMRGDTIGAWDGQARRSTFFTAEGEFVSSREASPIEHSFSSPPGTFIALQPQVSGMYADGSVLAQLVIVYPDVDRGVRRDSVPLVVFDREAGEWETAGTVLALEAFIDPDSEVLPVLPLPFGLRTRLAVADDWSVIGAGDASGLRVADRTGRLETVVNPGFRRLRLERDEITSDRNRRVEEVQESLRDEYRTALAAVPYPEFRPAHGRVIAAEDEFWVEGPAGGAGETTSWFVFSRSGRLLGSVRVDADLRITDVGEDHVIGVQTGDLGVPRVLMFELDRGSPETSDAR